MTPAQLAVLIDQHNAAHAPSDGKHARTTRETNDPADLLALAAMRRAG